MYSSHTSCDDGRYSPINVRSVFWKMTKRNYYYLSMLLLNLYAYYIYYAYDTVFTVTRRF